MRRLVHTRRSCARSSWTSSTRASYRSAGAAAAARWPRCTPSASMLSRWRVRPWPTASGAPPPTPCGSCARGGARCCSACLPRQRTRRSRSRVKPGGAWGPTAPEGRPLAQGCPLGPEARGGPPLAGRREVVAALGRPPELAAPAAPGRAGTRGIALLVATANPGGCGGDAGPPAPLRRSPPTTHGAQARARRGRASSCTAQHVILTWARTEARSYVPRQSRIAYIWLPTRAPAPGPARQRSAQSRIREWRLERL